MNRISTPIPICAPQPPVPKSSGSSCSPPGTPSSMPLITAPSVWDRVTRRTSRCGSDGSPRRAKPAGLHALLNVAHPYPTLNTQTSSDQYNAGTFRQWTMLYPIIISNSTLFVAVKISCSPVCEVYEKYLLLPILLALARQKPDVPSLHPMTSLPSASFNS